MYHLMYHLLLVDDDPMLAPLITHVLGKDFRVTSAATLADAEQLVKNETYDLVLLDVSLPDGSGYNFCTRLRELSSYREVPVLFLSGHSQVADKVMGFTLGADDYITKPCSVDELRMRVRARLKGVTFRKSEESPREGSLRVGLMAQRIFLRPKEGKEAPLALTSAEFRLLSYFMQHEDQVFTHRQIGAVVSEDGRATDDVVEACVSELRRKLAPSRYTIANIYDAGYKFTDAQK